MPIGNTPQNQLAALPLIGAQQVTDPTDTVVVGGNVAKFWNETALNINNIQRNNDGTGGANLFGPFIDMRGMNSGTLLLVRTAAAAGIDATTAQLYFLFRFGTFGNQPSNQTGAGQINLYSHFVASLTLAVTPGIGSEIFALGWTNTGAGYAQTLQPLALSADVFPVIHFSNPNNVNVTWSARLYAQSC
jgi:hypothetical protein